jgi:hypothetical protein
VQVDTTKILFIVGGAFDGLEKVIRARSEKGGIGFGAALGHVEAAIGQAHDDQAGHRLGDGQALLGQPGQLDLDLVAGRLDPELDGDRMEDGAVGLVARRARVPVAVAEAAGVVIGDFLEGGGGVLSARGRDSSPRRGAGPGAWAPSRSSR